VWGVGLLGGLGLLGCKGKEVVKPDEQTLKDLDDCKKAKAEKDKLIVALQDENAKLMSKQGGGEIVVTIEGANLTVRPGKPGDVAPIPDKVAAAAVTEFLDVVAKSKGEIQKCYEQALKKNSGLQAKTVTLTVNATFGESGAHASSSFAPSLGEPFDSCIKRVASRWALSQGAPAMTFKAPVSLTPS
jgi:hypothetical protein